MQLSSLFLAFVFSFFSSLSVPPLPPRYVSVYERKRIFSLSSSTCCCRRRYFVCVCVWILCFTLHVYELHSAHWLPWGVFAIYIIRQFQWCSVLSKIVNNSIAAKCVDERTPGQHATNYVNRGRIV